MWFARLMVAGIIGVVGIASSKSTSTSPCLAQSQYGDWAIADFRWTDTTSDTASVSRRQRWNLPSVSATQIVLVSDTTKCRRAVDAYNAALLPDTVVTSSLYLFAYGPTRYIAVDTARHAGEWDMHVVFDTGFAGPLHIFRR